MRLRIGLSFEDPPDEEREPVLELVHRDTELLPHVVDAYQPGAVLHEPDLFRASCLDTGFAAPHRFVFATWSAVRLFIQMKAEHPLNLGIEIQTHATETNHPLDDEAAARGEVFLPVGTRWRVLDRAEGGGRVQVLLLEEDESVRLEDEADEARLVEHVRQAFERNRDAAPVAALTDWPWIDRTRRPIGVQWDGTPIPEGAPSVRQD